MKILLSLLFIILSILGCRNDDSGDDSGGDCTKAKDMEKQYYFTANIAGEEVRMENETDGVLYPEKTESGFGDFCYKGFRMSVRSHASFSGTGLTVDFDKLMIYEEDCDSIPPNQDFITAFKVGEYNYLVGHNYESRESTVIIYYRDENGEEWTSNIGPQGEESIFFVLESNESTLCKYSKSPKVDVLCQFNCTLYNYRSNEQLEIRNGEAFYVFVDF